ncbi:MAG: energy-coupling factor ABC transporter substrate-binding protein [Actinomycetota bacterium]
MNKSNQGWNNWLLLAGVVFLAVMPLVLLRGAEFSGSDGEAKKAIAQIQPEYQPWFNAVFKPPSSEIESLLFSLQAGLGTGVVGYAIGWYQGRSEVNQEPKNKKDE